MAASVCALPFLVSTRIGVLGSAAVASNEYQKAFGDQEFFIRLLQYVAQDKQMKAFGDMSPSVDVRPSFPSVEMMFTLMDTTMANIYAKKDSIQSALQAAQDQTQRWLDMDNAAKK